MMYQNGYAVCNIWTQHLSAWFVCLGFIVQIENFSLIWRRHHYRWRAANFDLCSALMAIEQWGFLSVPHLLWHGAFIYIGHLRGPVTLTHVAERLAVELSLYLFLRHRSVTAGIRTPTLFFFLHILQRKTDSTRSYNIK